MVESEKMMIAGQELQRAFALLDRANEIILPTLPQLTTKRGLLDEARRAVNAAKDALAH